MPTSAWVGALAVGLTLGLFGSGGSILMVPLLVYVVRQPEKVAITGSLAIVGGIALVGAAVSGLRRRIDWPSVIAFAPSGMAGTYMGAWVAGSVSGATQLLAFASVMIAAAWFMLRSPTLEACGHTHGFSMSTMLTRGFAVGMLTGFVGVGGGFLIVPALVLGAGLSMHLAVGTSLAIIALTSIVGFLKNLEMLSASGLSVDWFIIAAFTIIGVTGHLTGHVVGSRIPQTQLKRAFACLLIVAGAGIMWRTRG
jgi:uncharacterized membrane protein YfcA